MCLFLLSTKLQSFVKIIDNILNNCGFDETLKKALIKSDISDYFTIIFTIQTGKNQGKCQTLVCNKRDFNKAKKLAFKQQLSLLHRWHVISKKDMRNFWKFMKFSLQTRYCKTRRRKKVLEWVRSWKNYLFRRKNCM